MTLTDAPILILGLTVTFYWLCVARLVYWVRSKTAWVQEVLAPAQQRERIMWAAWLPIIAVWCFTPFKVLSGFGNLLDHSMLPMAVEESELMLVIRFVSAGVAMLCLALSMRVWRHMGTQWRMGVDPSQDVTLLVDGPFARVRHPIYTLSILMMLCSVVVLPAPVMVLLAVAHLTLMHLKARNEERFLLETKGAAYASYCRKTGRFLPFVRTRPPRYVPKWDETDTAPDRPIRDWKDGGNYPFRLNYFQQEMLAWDRQHPYNALHVVRFPGGADVDKLRDAVWGVSTRMRLGEFVCNRRGTAYEYRPLQVVEVVELPPAVDCTSRLHEAIDRELNTGFSGGMHHPVRWTVFDAPDENAHYIVLCYQHVVSDSRSIQRLMAAVLRRYAGRPATAEDGQLTTRLSDVRQSLGLKPRLYDLWSAFVQLGFQHRDGRSTHRMPDERYGGDYTSAVFRTAPAGLSERLRARCRRHKIGLNDTLLAALASALAEHMTERHTNRQRGMALATVASTRPHLPPEQAEDFGVSLSHIVVVVRDPDASMEGVMQEIRAQSQIWREEPRRAAAETVVRSLAARWLGWIAGGQLDRRTLRRTFPISGGLSTVRVDTSCFSDLPIDDMRYIRVSPTGPSVPLALAPTIMDGRLELSLTYRIASRTRAQAEALLDLVLARLEALAEPDSPAPETAHARETAAAAVGRAMVHQGP